jgi:hypothetical protein
MGTAKMRRLCVLDEVYEHATADAEKIQEAMEGFIEVKVDGKTIYVNPGHITTIEFAEGAGLKAI